ncbi:division/cell wall cluster transcriptional repressor MraZ [Mycoplasmopsis agassizii]|uniref:Transcriptional regulator MraZ n=1 Tax=Mycoplasmopsis agassizii TaxID=33922 RepID=A0ABX4H6E7_9BACT|nr:hypothetical protein [Mycoplasmopsis agassizii]PAF55459.1 hypothetical protein CJF60_02125 [Mycoplasmopsis agassizii]SMC18900.1 MraZ protein [Mycoplasmopsis agassizii]
MGNFGNFERTLDDNLRVAIPTKFKDHFGSRFFLFRTFNNVLEMWTDADFNAESQKLDLIDLRDIEAIKYKRAFYQRIEEVTVDKVGRIKLTNNIVEKTSIKKEVVFVGIGNKVEIWSKEAYDSFDDEMNDEAYAKAAAAIFNRNDKKGSE